MDITKYLIHKAVLWSYSSVNGYGEVSFDTATEIDVRWEEGNEIFIASDGSNKVSKAIVFVNQSIDPRSFMYKGELTDLSAAEKADPQTVTNAFPVESYSEIPDISGTQVLRKIFLGGK